MNARKTVKIKPKSRIHQHARRQSRCLRRSSLGTHKRRKPGRRWRGGSRPRRRSGPSPTTARPLGSGRLHKDTTYNEQRNVLSHRAALLPVCVSRLQDARGGGGGLTGVEGGAAELLRCEHVPGWNLGHWADDGLKACKARYEHGVPAARVTLAKSQLQRQRRRRWGTHHFFGGGREVP